MTRDASLGDARSYLTKAHEFLAAAENSFNLDNRVAATGNAVNAGILAADAIAASRAGQVWKGEHARAANHLEKVGGSDGKRAATHLRRLLPLKNRAQYDPDPVSVRDAKAALLAAKGIMATADDVVPRK
jgi:fructose-specific component phosphotransferase system IIB-like protein